jgi:hypothetical protein
VIKIEQPYTKPVEKEFEEIETAEKPSTEYFKGLKTVRD